MSALIRNLSSVHRICASGAVAFGDVTYRPGGQCGPRVQQDFQLVAIYEGEAHIQVDDAMRYLPGQHVALMRPGHAEYFHFAAATQTHHTWCAVHPSLVDEPLREALAAMPFCLPITPRLHGLIEMGLSFAPSDLPSAQALLVQLGLSALHAYAFEAERAALHSLTPDAVVKAQRFIEAHLSQPITLDEIARAANVSPAHLIKLFRRHLHTTPMRYAWDARARRGAQLLIQSGLPVGEIAAQCGFQTPFHFSRLIKQRYGCAPRELRRRAWA
ncbi:MAG: AraC family transcriptional regulator [Anaerolineae bacterium]|nr:AraC family transcriptional regulator [Candidatus Roseilinea sp.]MDW8449897.1 AraC family transcriptional regulator [Anaerolineae bacterium]